MVFDRIRSADLRTLKSIFLEQPNETLRQCRISCYVKLHELIKCSVRFYDKYFIKNTKCFSCILKASDRAERKVEADDSRAHKLQTLEVHQHILLVLFIVTQS